MSCYQVADSQQGTTCQCSLHATGPWVCQIENCSHQTTQIVFWGRKEWKSIDCKEFYNGDSCSQLQAAWGAICQVQAEEKSWGEKEGTPTSSLLHFNFIFSCIRPTMSVRIYFRMPLFLWFHLGFPEALNSPLLSLPFLRHWAASSSQCLENQGEAKGVSITLKGSRKERHTVSPLSFLEQREQGKKEREMKQKGGSSFYPFLSVNALIFFCYSKWGSAWRKRKEKAEVCGKPCVLVDANQLHGHGLMELWVLYICISPLDFVYFFMCIWTMAS